MFGSVLAMMALGFEGSGAALPGRRQDPVREVCEQVFGHFGEVEIRPTDYEEGWKRVGWRGGFLYLDAKGRIRTLGGRPVSPLLQGDRLLSEDQFQGAIAEVARLSGAPDGVVIAKTQVHEQYQSAQYRVRIGSLLSASEGRLRIRRPSPPSFHARLVQHQLPPDGPPEPRTSAWDAQNAIVSRARQDDAAQGALIHVSDAELVYYDPRYNVDSDSDSGREGAFERSVLCWKVRIHYISRYALVENSSSVVNARTGRLERYQSTLGAAGGGKVAPRVPKTPATSLLRKKSSHRVVLWQKVQERPPGEGEPVLVDFSDPELPRKYVSMLYDPKRNLVWDPTGTFPLVHRVQLK